MPSTKRQQLRRFWAQGKNDLEKAAIEVMRLKDVFEPTHPQYGQLCELVLGQIYIAMDGWDAFALHAWGKVPEHTISWMA